MLYANETVTLYNRLPDESWSRTVIKGVSWFGQYEAQAEREGVRLDFSVKARIPENADFGGKQYVSSLLWSQQKAATCWTLQEGDLLFRGVCEQMDGPPDLGEAYEGCVVKSWADNRRGGQGHWKVIGA